MTARKDSGRGRNCLKKTTVFFKQSAKLHCSQIKLRNATTKTSCIILPRSVEFVNPFFQKTEGISPSRAKKPRQLIHRPAHL